MNKLQGMAALAGISVLWIAACTSPPPEQTTVSLPQAALNELRSVDAFAAIRDEKERSLALFEEAGKVLQHPRCVNCHPRSDRPLQTDAMRPHNPLVVRGADGHGAPGLPCTTCHHATNYDPARVPGHPNWHLAPESMAWEGRSLGQICEQIKDSKRNGGKDMEALLRHMEADSLVGWGWTPGAGRTPVPGTQAEFGKLMRAWAESGAHCPRA